MSFLIVGLLVLSSGYALAAPTESISLAPIHAQLSPIEGEYLIAFKDEHTLEKHLQTVPGLREIELKHFGYPRTWGYGAALTDDLLLSVRQDSGVDFVEQNGMGEWAVLDEEPHRDEANEARALEARIDQTTAGYALRYISSKQKSPAKDVYHYVAGSGLNVDVYIVDSGITVDSAEFGSRVIDFINISGEKTFNDTYKTDGHGTGVAACAGAYHYGSAKLPNLVNVKINPTNINMALALTKIQQRHEQRKSQSNFKGSVINMSFHLGSSQANIKALQSAYNAGITMVAAAGNDGVETPARFPCVSEYTICIASSDSGYQRSSFSNYGTQVAFFASGTKVSTLSRQGYTYAASGTSFSSPYTAGVVAIFYGYLGYDKMSPSMALDLLNYNADSGYLENLPANTKNLMVNSGYTKATDGQPFLMAYPS